MLPILYRDEHLVAVHKPAGLLVHRTSIDPGERCFALQMVRDQLGQRVHAVHRLDKGTSGVLVFALDAETAVEAARIRATYRLRLPDAIQVATAIRAGAAALVTHDGELRRVRGLRVIGPG